MKDSSPKEQKNEHGFLATPYDNKKALVVGDHPHTGETAKCLGAEKLSVGPGWGLRFKGDFNEFYIMNPINIKWI